MESEEKALLNFLLGCTSDKNKNRKSCFIMALKSARYHMGRDITTGEGNHIEMTCAKAMQEGVIENNLLDEEEFTGVVLYLILLDLIGCLFVNKTKKTSNRNGIKNALYYFSTLNESEIEVIYTRRNTLAHNFGLTTEQRVQQKYKFTLTFNDDDPMVKPASTTWCGDYSNKSLETSTVIGVCKLCKTIEDIAETLLKLCRRDEFGFKDGLNIHEIYARFTCIKD